MLSLTSSLDPQCHTDGQRGLPTSPICLTRLARGSHIWRYCNEKWPWHFTKIIFYYKPMLSSSARRLQLTKERQHLTVRKKVRWCRAIPFQHFPKENVIFKNARISIPTTRVFGKYPRVRHICPQMEKLICLEIWKMNWGSAKATNHCGTFIWQGGWWC